MSGRELVVEKVGRYRRLYISFRIVVSFGSKGEVCDGEGYKGVLIVFVKFRLKKV